MTGGFACNGSVLLRELLCGRPSLRSGHDGFCTISARTFRKADRGQLALVQR